jgi:hypothetical protein
MRWFILRLISEWWSYNFKTCPRIEAGYACKAYRPGGCADCGRRFGAGR